MSKKPATHSKPTLRPLNSLAFVSAKSTLTVPPASVTLEKVGEKAFGLSCLPQLWIPPFIVVSDELLSLYINCSAFDQNQLLEDWSTRIIESALSVQISEHDHIIVRSSGYAEGLEERGKFYSVQGELSNTLKPLNECLRKLASDKELCKQRIPLIIQKCIVPISAKGHLSNERRCYEEKRDWLGEYEEIETKLAKPFKINLRNWRRKINVGKWKGQQLICNLSAHVSEILKIPAAWTYEQGLRIHFEWVWDGKTIYIVQSDEEHESNGIDPTVLNTLKKRKSIGFKPSCVKKINESNAHVYNKVSNVFTYTELGLPITSLYILDDQKVINKLALGQVSPYLEKDISHLVEGSLVIRMDIATNNKNKRQLLPRTNEVREFDMAIRWLKEQSHMVKNSGMQDDVAFIFHNFVPAVSSAFAYAAPRERKVQIEALWGLPEGLYYHAHDKYVVDTKKREIREIQKTHIGKFEVREKRSYKKFFVAPDEDGHWKTKILRSPFDWRGSIQKKEWVNEIAFQSRRIAEAEGKSLSIMWFVGVHQEACSNPIFPWYHEPYDPVVTNRAQTHRTKTPFDKSLVIRTNADIEELRREADANRSSVRRVRIQPREEKLLRDKNTLRMIGELTQKIDAVILLEGGVLSHAYYQLMETNAMVEVLHPFGDFDDRREFNKLVRDKIPSNIESGGEEVSKTRLSGEFFLRALREKLVEEAFEVLDAIDQDSIIEELADVSEIIDGILSQLRASREDLELQQNKKREKAGGFRDGYVLLETKNPLPIKKSAAHDGALFDHIYLTDTRNNIPIDAREVLWRSQAIEKWSDRREHQAATEVILHLEVPLIRDDWTANTPLMVTDSYSGKTCWIKIIGKRVGTKSQIELSVFTQPQQLKLF